MSLSPAMKIASSLILKDMVGCGLYVTQARSNKKMTPQQRADVANYDLANGVINVGLQLFAVKPIEKLMRKFVEKNWIQHFFTNIEKKTAPSNKSSDIIKFLGKKKNLTEGSVALLSVLVCQYFIKRVVSPFLSVPAGEKTKEWGLVKPKLYPGETHDKKSITDILFEKDIFNKIKLPKRNKENIVA